MEGRLHRRLIAGIAALALLVLTAAATTSMRCADGSPCGLRVFSGPMMAVADNAGGDHSCCLGGLEGSGLIVGRQAGCNYDGDTYNATVQAPTTPVFVAALLPSPFSFAAPRVAHRPAAEAPSSAPAWRGESPPGNRGPPPVVA